MAIFTPRVRPSTSAVAAAPPKPAISAPREPEKAISPAKSSTRATPVQRVTGLGSSAVQTAIGRPIASSIETVFGFSPTPRNLQPAPVVAASTASSCEAARTTRLMSATAAIPTRTPRRMRVAATRGSGEPSARAPAATKSTATVKMRPIVRRGSTDHSADSTPTATSTAARTQPSGTERSLVPRAANWQERDRRKREQRDPAPRSADPRETVHRARAEGEEDDGDGEQERDRSFDGQAPDHVHDGPGYVSAVAYPERIVPDETPPGPLAIHEKRYLFALTYCAGKRVLDGACGVGYGTALLADRAAEVVGVDIDADSIAYARSRYARPNIEFRVDDLTAPELDDRSFDVVCSFETIEHVPDREAYLAHVVRVLRDDGLFVVSTPRADETTGSPDNPYHFVEYSRRDFQALLSRRFGKVELFGQRRLQTKRHRALQRLDVLGLRRRAGFLRSLGRVRDGNRADARRVAGGHRHRPPRRRSADVIVAVCRMPIRE